jgi:FKBP12-rapamycin complex-associated protein
MEFATQIEAQEKFMSVLKENLYSLIKSNALDKHLLAINIIKSLIDIPIGDTLSRTTDFCVLLRTVVSADKVAPIIVTNTSKVLGLVVRAGGSQCADVIESEIKRYLEWLQTDRKFTAVNILRELCVNAPAVFFNYVPRFSAIVISFLADKQISLRTSAFDALSACRLLLVERDTEGKCLEFDQTVLDVADQCFKSATTDSIQGGILSNACVLQFLPTSTLLNTIPQKRTELTRQILKYLNEKKHKELVLSVLPFIYAPTETVLSLLSLISSGDRKALAAVAVLIEDGIKNNTISLYYDKILFAVHKSFSNSRSSHSSCSPESLACVVALAHFNDPHCKVKALIPGLLTRKLTYPLVVAIHELSKSIPSQVIL